MRSIPLSPPFRGFFLGRLISLLGSAMTPVALALSVLNASGEPTDLGVVMASQILPQLVLLLAGGAIADRFPRRTLLWVSNLGAGLTQGGVAALLLTGHFSLPAAAGLSAMNGAIEAFASPALRGVLPDLVAPVSPPAAPGPPAHGSLQRANSLLASSQNAAKLLGPTAGGLLVVGIGGGWAIALDAASFFVAACFFSRLPAHLPARLSEVGGEVARKVRGEAAREVGVRVGAEQDGADGNARVGTASGRRMLADIGEGWREFRAIPWVVAMAVSFGFLNLVNVGPWQILGPTLTREHGSEAAWGVVLSVRAIGLLAMSAAMYRLTLPRPLRDASLLGLAGALPLLALGLGFGTPWLAACAFVGALGFTAKGVAWDTALQTRVPRHALSRIVSIDDLLSYAAIPVGELLTGPAATHFGARAVAFWCGVGYLVANTVPLAVRSVRLFRLVVGDIE